MDPFVCFTTSPLAAGHAAVVGNATTTTTSSNSGGGGGGGGRGRAATPVSVHNASLRSNNSSHGAMMMAAAAGGGGNNMTLPLPAISSVHATPYAAGNNSNNSSSNNAVTVGYDVNARTASIATPIAFTSVANVLGHNHAHNTSNSSNNNNNSGRGSRVAAPVVGMSSQLAGRRTSPVVVAHTPVGTMGVVVGATTAAAATTTTAAQQQHHPQQQQQSSPMMSGNSSHAAAAATSSHIGGGGGGVHVPIRVAGNSSHVVVGAAGHAPVGYARVAAGAGAATSPAAATSAAAPTAAAAAAMPHAFASHDAAALRTLEHLSSSNNNNNSHVNVHASHDAVVPGGGGSGDGMVYEHWAHYGNIHITASMQYTSIDDKSLEHLQMTLSRLRSVVEGRATVPWYELMDVHGVSASAQRLQSALAAIAAMTPPLPSQQQQGGNNNNNSSSSRDDMHATAAAAAARLAEAYQAIAACVTSPVHLHIVAQLDEQHRHAVRDVVLQALLDQLTATCEQPIILVCADMLTCMARLGLVRLGGVVAAVEQFLCSPERQRAGVTMLARVVEQFSDDAAFVQLLRSAKKIELMLHALYSSPEYECDVVAIMRLLGRFTATTTTTTPAATTATTATAAARSSSSSSSSTATDAATTTRTTCAVAAAAAAGEGDDDNDDGSSPHNGMRGDASGNKAQGGTQHGESSDNVAAAAATTTAAMPSPSSASSAMLLLLQPVCLLARQAPLCCMHYVRARDELVTAHADGQVMRWGAPDAATGDVMPQCLSELPRGCVPVALAGYSHRSSRRRGGRGYVVVAGMPYDHHTMRHHVVPHDGAYVGSDYEQQQQQQQPWHEGSSGMQYMDYDDNSGHHLVARAPRHAASSSLRPSLSSAHDLRAVLPVLQLLRCRDDDDGSDGQHDDEQHHHNDDNDEQHGDLHAADAVAAAATTQRHRRLSSGSSSNHNNGGGGGGERYAAMHGSAWSSNNSSGGDACVTITRPADTILTAVAALSLDVFCTAERAYHHHSSSAGSHDHQLQHHGSGGGVVAEYGTSVAQHNLVVYDVATMQPTHTLACAHDDYITVLSACDDDEHVVLSGSRDMTVKLWDIRSATHAIGSSSSSSSHHHSNDNNGDSSSNVFATRSTLHAAVMTPPHPQQPQQQSSASASPPFAVAAAEHASTAHNGYSLVAAPRVLAARDVCGGVSAFTDTISCIYSIRNLVFAGSLDGVMRVYDVRQFATPLMTRSFVSSVLDMTALDGGTLAVATARGFYVLSLATMGAVDVLPNAVFTQLATNDAGNIVFAASADGVGILALAR